MVVNQCWGRTTIKIFFCPVVVVMLFVFYDGNRRYCMVLYRIVLYLSTDNALTESRLEEHDKRYGSPLTMRQLLGEDIMSVSPTDMHSVNTGDGIVGNRYPAGVLLFLHVNLFCLLLFY